ncbi:MAG: hypothetical protein LBJ86_04180 [Spirochaetaceae bacterium]|jgi:hypothetical protein|nr:hypothetical protein [Spirochaetaceae bacterium]
MTLTKTVAVPTDRRVRFDLTLPETFAPGSLLCFEINPRIVKPKTKAAMLSTVGRIYAGVYPERRDAENLLERKTGECGVRGAVSLMDLYGSCEGEDTLDEYFERKRADKAFEEKRFMPHVKETSA